MGCSQALAQKLKVVLDKITTARARFIGATKSPWWVEPTCMTHIVGILITIILTAAVVHKAQDVSFFTLHPLCMAFAFMVMMPEGIVAYRNLVLLNSLSPIMQHGTRSKKRNIHSTLQVLAAIFAGLGLIFIVANKIHAERSILPHTIHAIFGTVTLAAMALQVVVGRLKHMSFTTGVIDARNRVKKYRWHGKMGLLLYDMTTATFILGVFALFGFSIVSILVPMMVAYAWLNVNLQMHETRHITVPVYSEGIDAEKSEATPEGQQLVEEGVPETKGEREYPV